MTGATTAAPVMPDGFSTLSPEAVVAAAETALGCRFMPVTIPFPSYINRVYELRKIDGTAVVAKFYRPGRWSKAALAEEHEFMAACVADELPVVAPLELKSGGTLGECAEGIWFALYPKKAGRRFEPETPENWRRLGRLVARLHLAGEKLPQVANRPVLTPERSTRAALNDLLAMPFIPVRVKNELERIALELIETASPEMEGVELLAVHGDLHSGNIIDRPGEGLTLIDFDDMAVAPAAQDLWMLLPDSAFKCGAELERLTAGYRELRELDAAEPELLESLRAMRMFYYLDWCAKQKKDFMFDRVYPDWGTPEFWRNELSELAAQLHLLADGPDDDGKCGEAGDDDEDDGETSWLI
ncbi:MAG: serine/threonine protein kinase [Victivallaceae bacterium]|nr:serine/threonine protein kinase [Victivallaceae bacterium]